MIDGILDFLFPRRSLTDGEGEFVTPDELRALQCAPVILTEAQLRSQGLLFIDRITACAEYDRVPLLHRAIHLFKYRKVRGVGEVLGGMLVRTSGLLSIPSPLRPSPAAAGEGDCPTLCPVPLHWVRRFSRGFNQAEILARIVGRERGWEVCSLLKRKKWTGSQVGRRRKERMKGVRDAFEVKNGLGTGTGLGTLDHVILVDDLSTTGATLDACAKALKKSGVKKVEGLVIALG